MPYSVLTNEELNKLIEAQMQRDFLKSHAQTIAKKANLKLPVVLDTSLENPRMRSEQDNAQLHLQFLIEEARAYEAFLHTASSLRPQHAAYISAVLLPNRCQADAGISTNLSYQFAQLVAPSADTKKLDEKRPFVQLQDQGLCFYWKTAADAAAFANMLQAHGFPVETEFEKLPARYLPNQTTLPDYQSNQTSLVRIPHRYVEHLLALAHYHPYQYKRILTELYENKLDRTTAIVQEAMREGTMARQQDVNVSEALRFSLNDQEDVIALTVEANRPQSVSSTPSHLILVIDDSGSMGGEKMAATNVAINKLIQSLDDDTLVSIQTLNRPTDAYRCRAEALKKQHCDFPATASTPLLETIMSSALFVREHPLDTVISADTLNHTMMVVFTDGQPNGGTQDSVEKLLLGLQKTQVVPFNRFVAHHDMNLPNAPVSFGTNAVPCEADPVILGFCIGQRADTQFMKDLAQRFNTPKGFIRTDSNMASDMDQAMALIKELEGRYERAFVGVSYTDRETGAVHASGQELHNLFYDHARTVFIRVPKDAPAEAALMHDSHVTKGIRVKVATATQEEDIKAQFVQSALVELMQTHEQQALLLRHNLADKPQLILPPELALELNKPGTSAAPVAYRRGATPPPEPKTLKDYEKEKEVAAQQHPAGSSALQQAFAEIEQRKQAQAEKQVRITRLQQEHEEKLNAADPAAALTQKTTQALLELKKLVPASNAALHAEIGLFQNQILPTHTFTHAGYPSVQSDLGRVAIAQYSQLRMVGKKVAQDPMAQSGRLSALLKLIEEGEFEAALNLISQQNTLLNDVDAKKGTPLHATLYLLSETKDTAHHWQLLRFFQTLCAHPAAQLTTQDSTGNTVAHKAAWWGCTDALSIIFHEARAKNSLKDLLATRNYTHVGGTTAGETVLDNIRLSKRLPAGEPHALIISLYDEVHYPQPNGFQDCLAARHPNGHYEPAQNTPLMLALGYLAQKSIPSDIKASMRVAILAYIDKHQATLRLDEASIHGNTALHFAFWNHETAIALKILQTAKAQGPAQLQNVLAARNIVGGVGEVPHMNLAAKLLARPNPKQLLSYLEALLSQLVLRYPTATDENGTLVQLDRCYDASNPLQSTTTIITLLLKNNSLKDDEGSLCALMLAQETLKAFDTLNQTFFFIKEHLSPNAQTELGHLLTVYQNELEGYCPFNFLKASPIVGLTACLDKLRTKTLPEKLQALPDNLEEVRLNMNLVYVNTLQEWLEKWLRANRAASSLPFFKADPSLLPLLEETSRQLSMVTYAQNVASASLGN